MSTISDRMRHILLLLLFMGQAGVFAQQTEQPDTLNRSLPYIWEGYAANSMDSELRIEAERTPDNRSAIPFVLLLVLPVYSLYTYYNRKYLVENIKLLGNFRLMDQVERERELASSFPSWMLMVFFFICIGLLAFYFVDGSFGALAEWELLLVVLALVPLLYGIRAISYWLFGLVFDFKQVIDFFRFSKGVYYQLAGYALYPFIVVLFLAGNDVASISLYMILGLIILLVLIRLQALLRIAQSIAGFRVSYFFLYFCAFEIAPILVGIRLLKDQAFFAI